MTQKNFGYETAEATHQQISNIIAGSKFTCPDAGTADSITFYIGVAVGSTGGGVKCAIYDSSLNLIAQTEERTITVAMENTWQTFNFNNPKPSLSASTVYWLVAWASFPSDYYRFYIHYTTGDANQGLTKSETYATNFPNPLTSPTYSTMKCSIYCTYTVGGITGWRKLKYFS